METKKYVRIIRNVNKYGDKTGRIFPSLGTCEDSYKIDGPNGVMYVRKRDAEVLVTENRKAAVGECVLITKTVSSSGTYKVGDIFTVQTADEYGGIFVEERLAFLIRPEYEVIVDSEVKNEEADETKIDLNAMGYDELIAHGEEVMRMIRIRACGEGYKQGKFDADMEATYMRPQGKSAQARRDEIIEQAKADLENLADEDGPVYQTEDNEGYPCSCYANFRVNKEHRTVACDLRGVRTGERYKRGIAKAAPDDCFNVHIGKAIALRRALGLAVSDEYLNAPQPTVVRVGDVVRGKYEESYYRYEGRLFGDSYEEQIKEIEDGKFRYMSGDYDFIDSADLTIIDDSREEVGE
ncbi:hypothetical protein MOB18_21195 [Bacillus inaquosorum]|uniref:hypothetical protein n=1 Tax=Bacillus inaquosorum TaxID=483913 RepID=UPI002280EFA4|nr:hypothetical protein [Bacillus inaquosorum]MCY7751579.1 hypothetical protein [Bacillus inaquosorum]